MIGVQQDPHPALRADLSHFVGEVYEWRAAARLR